VWDAVYGKIGGKVIPKYPINMPKNRAAVSLRPRTLFFRIKRTYRYRYPAYREKFCEADPQCRDVKFRKLRMRAYFADCGDIWKNRFINLTKSAHAALASKMSSGGTNTLGAVIANSAKTAA